MGRCARCGQPMPGDVFGAVCSTCQRNEEEKRMRASQNEAQKNKQAAERARAEERAMDWQQYTDQFGNKVRVSRTTGRFEVKRPFWGWMESFQGNIERRYPNGDLYVGGVHGSFYHGKGKKFWKETGNSYEGDWVYDHRTGKGRFTWANGNYYEGDFVEGNRTGKGKYVWASGGYYEGDFVEGKFNGYGVRVYQAGGRYEGQFKDDMCHGKGKMTWPNGDIYEGDWFEDFRAGKGKTVWANGVYYEGEYLKGKCHGNGFRTYTDNYTYKGQFKDGVRHGKGVLTAPDGTAVEYYYENDKRVCKAAEATDEIIARIYGSIPQKAPAKPKVETKATVAPEVKNVSVAPTVSKTDAAYAETKATSGDLEIWDQLVKAKSAQKRKEEILASHSVIVIPEGTKRIPGYLFDKCLNLKGVRFNQDISEIGMWDFRGCKNLGPVVMIPKSVKKIYSYAFENCSSLKKIVLPNNITIDRLAFVDSGISEVEFETDPPRGVIVGYGAFKHCDKNMTKEMKEKIKKLNSNAFK